MALPGAPVSEPLRASINSDSSAHLRRARHFPSSLFAEAVTVTQISPIRLPVWEIPRTLDGMGKLLSSLGFCHLSCLGFHRQERDAAEEPYVRGKVITTEGLGAPNLGSERKGSALWQHCVRRRCQNPRQLSHTKPTTNVELWPCRAATSHRSSVKIPDN